MKRVMNFNLYFHYSFSLIKLNFFLSEISISWICHCYFCYFRIFKFQAPIEAVLQFEQEDEWNGLPISTPPYIICAKCSFDKCVPIDYKSKRGFHHIYKEK